MSTLPTLARQEYYAELGNALPAPLVAQPEYRQRRLATAVAAFAALCPGNAYEARLAVRIVLSGAHIAENFREARVFRADSAKRSRCRAQAAGMMREERAARRMLAREQKVRLATQAVASTPKPQPAASAPPPPEQAGSPPPPSPEAIAKAEAFAQQPVVAAARIRHRRGVTPRRKAYLPHQSLPTDPAVIDALVRGTSDAPTLLDQLGGEPRDNAARRAQRENMGHHPANRYFETATRRFRRSLPRHPLESAAAVTNGRVGPPHEPKQSPGVQGRSRWPFLPSGDCPSLAPMANITLA